MATVLRMSHVLHERHEAVIHMQLLMAVEKGEAGIIGYEIHFHGRFGGNNHYIFEHA
jgi:hypothetical protein